MSKVSIRMHMRKITLLMKALEQYEIIKRLSEEHISKGYAAIKIGCTKRIINRLLNIPKKKRLTLIMAIPYAKPLYSLSNQQKANIVSIYNNKYVLYIHEE